MAAKLRAGAVLLLVFAAGVLSGVVLERQWSAPQTAELSLEEEHQASMAELVEVLQLDEQQVAQIHAILAQRHKVVEQMWEQLRPEVRKAKLEVHDEINALLRPEQRERFHQWLRERHEAVPPEHPEATAHPQAPTHEER